MKTQVFLLFLSMNQFVFGQHIIKGVVTNRQGDSLFGVNIYIKDTYDGASSNINGEFIFKSNETGRCSLIASYIGYNLLETVILLDGDTIELELVLEEKINKIDGLTISAGAFEASDKKKSVLLKTFDIVTTAGATADITGVMNTLPGTQTVGEEGRLFVRGGDGQEAKTFINGLLVSQPFNQSPQNIPSRFRFSPFLFKGAFFSTGGYSAEYGQALSSILQLKTYELPARSQTDLSVMSLGADISQTIRINNTSLYGQFQYTDLSAYFALMPQKYEWEQAPNSLNSTIHVKQKFNGSGDIQVYSNYNLSEMKLMQPLPGNVYQNGFYDISNENTYTNIALNNALTPNTSLRGGLAFTLNKNEIILDEGLITENQIKSIHTKAVFDTDLSENIILKYGVEWIYDSYSEDILDSEKAESKNFNYENHLISLFSESDVYLSNKLIARLAGRYEYNTIFDDHNFSPRISLAYKLNQSSQFSMAYGRFSQRPTSSYLKWSQNLKFEKAEHYILNYQFSKEGRIFRTEAYYKKYNQLTTKEITVNQDFYFDNNGYGDASGIELFWRDSKTFKSIEYWMSYSFLNTERKYDIFSYPVMPYYASKHNVSVVYKHFIANIKSQIGWTYSITSGRPYTDPNTGIFNSKMTKNYNDLSLNYSYLFKPNMIIHVSVSNVLGFNSIFGYNYNRTPNDSGVYESIPIEPQAERFVFIGFFITISKDKNANQLNNF